MIKVITVKQLVQNTWLTLGQLLEAMEMMAESGMERGKLFETKHGFLYGEKK